MCVASMIGDHYRDKWREREWFDGIGYPSVPALPLNPVPLLVTQPPAISREEFDALRKEVLEMKELLKRAVKYDADNGEPECEVDEKMDLLRKVAKLVGVELNDVIKPAGA
jgi:hypothetical protein